jgi:hypothetical protein
MEGSELLGLSNWFISLGKYKSQELSHTCLTSNQQACHRLCKWHEHKNYVQHVLQWK